MIGIDCALINPLNAAVLEESKIRLQVCMISFKRSTFRIGYGLVLPVKVSSLDIVPINYPRLIVVVNDEIISASKSHIM